jgi:hypothetical protein
MPATVHNIVGFVGPPSRSSGLIRPDSLPRSRDGRGVRVESRERLCKVRIERRAHPNTRTTKTPDHKSHAPGGEYAPTPAPRTDKTDKTWRGSATELFVELEGRGASGLPENAEWWSKNVRSIAATTEGLTVDPGWRGKKQTLKLNLETTVGIVGGVGESPASANGPDNKYPNGGS